MARIHALIVGYRQGDPKIQQLWEEHGRLALPHKGCINCGQMTYFVQSGQDAIRDRDPEPICDRCWGEPDVKRALYASEL